MHGLKVAHQVIQYLFHNRYNIEDRYAKVVLFLKININIILIQEAKWQNVLPKYQNPYR